MGTRQRLSWERQIIGGVGWAIALLAAAGFASLIVFNDMHRPPTNQSL